MPQSQTAQGPGHVTLAGAGPGDPSLLTLGTVTALAAADSVLYDALVSPAILSYARPGAELIPVGKRAGAHSMAQIEINALIVAKAREGKRVVRLKGGDPFVFGRGGEEAIHLLRHGIQVEVVPGVTAAIGCAAAAGIPLTHRGVARSVRFVTGHCRGDEPLDLDWAGLADPETTLVVYMGHGQIGAIAERLMAHGLPASTAVAAIADGCSRRQRVLRTTLSGAADAVARSPSGAPVLFVIGRVVDVVAEGLALGAGRAFDARLLAPVLGHG